MNQLEGLGQIMQDWTTERENNADFFSHANQEYFVRVLEEFDFKDQRPIVFLPCASTKPISKSRTHCYLSPITRNDRICRIILSEPQTVIPYTLEKYCPVYNFPPDNLETKERTVMIRRLGIFLWKLSEMRKNRVLWYIGGKHHLSILREAVEIAGYFTVIGIVPPAGIRDYNKSAKILSQIISEAEE